jgi:hypothetical protein
LGYLALLGAYFLPIPFFQQRRGLVWWALLGYTVLTFILWVIMGDKTFTLDFSNGAAPDWFPARRPPTLLICDNGSACRCASREGAA